MRFAIVVTGPAYDMQQVSSAFQFAQALIVGGHRLSSVLFCRERVYSANQLILPASDEFDLVCGWQWLNTQHGVVLNICVTTALRRGIVGGIEVGRLRLASSSLQPGFTLSRLDALAETSLICDRAVQF